MKSKAVNWQNGSVLYAEQLKIDKSLNEDWLSNILQHICPYFYGITEITIDEIALINGIIKIDNLECIFSDGTYVQYTRSIDKYDLSLDLNHMSSIVNKSVKIFLVRSQEIYEENIEIISQIGDIVPISIGKPMLIISDQVNQVTSLPFAEVYSKSGSFCLSNFCGPVLKIKKYSSLGRYIQNFCLRLKNLVLEIKSQMLLSNNNINDDIKLFVKYCQEILINIEIAYSNEFHPFEFYKVIWQSVALLVWKENNLPKLIEYNHLDIRTSIENSLSILDNIISGSRSAYNSLIFMQDHNVFKCLLNDLGKEDLLLTIYPSSIEIKEWIMNTIICSESQTEKMKIERNPGIDREIINISSDCVVLKLNKNSPYLKVGEQLIIYNYNMIFVDTISLSVLTN